MKKLYCPYCGRPLSAGCDCEEQARKWDNEGKLYRDIDDQREWDSMEGAEVDDIIAMYRAE